MKKTSLVDAKARLSVLVDEAEHHQRGTVILRHGKPAAAIVPVRAVTKGRSRARAHFTSADVRRILDRFGASPETSAVADLLASRR